jgi:hypothetical protein
MTEAAEAEEIKGSDFLLTLRTQSSDQQYEYKVITRWDAIRHDNFEKDVFVHFPKPAALVEAGVLTKDQAEQSGVNEGYKQLGYVVLLKPGSTVFNIFATEAVCVSTYFKACERYYRMPGRECKMSPLLDKLADIFKLCTKTVGSFVAVEVLVPGGEFI